MATNLLPLGSLGAVENNGTVTFGIWLPWVSAGDGNNVTLKIIHERDQFLQAIPPSEFALTHSVRAPYGDFWSVTVPICGQSFKPRSQVPKQAYCSAPKCQCERRRKWQRHKLKTDPDYENNQARAQQAWTQRNPDYWREYRALNPKYVERNRQLQQTRNAQHIASPIAKMDASMPASLLPSGIYRLQLLADDGIAKMDMWIVEITAHSCECKPDVNIAKR